MNPYLGLTIYVGTLIYCLCKLASKKPISKWDYFGTSLSYAFFGLAWVIEKFTV